MSTFNLSAVPVWRKSTHSGGGGGCVEVAINLTDTTGFVHVRDTKDNGNGPILTIPADAWRAFTGAIRAGGYDI
jgi:hypothetical protein